MKTPVILIIQVCLIAICKLYAQQTYLQLNANEIYGINENSYRTNNANNGTVKAPIKINRNNFGLNVCLHRTNKSDFFSRIKLNYTLMNDQYIYNNGINRAMHDSACSIYYTVEKHYGVAIEFGKEIRLEKFRFICGMGGAYSINNKPLQKTEYLKYHTSELISKRNNIISNTNNIFQSLSLGLLLGIHYNIYRRFWLGGELNQNLLFSFHKGQQSYQTNTFDVNTNTVSNSVVRKDGFITNTFESNVQRPLFSFSFSYLLKR